MQHVVRTASRNIRMTTPDDVDWDYFKYSQVHLESKHSVYRTLHCLQKYQNWWRFGGTNLVWKSSRISPVYKPNVNYKAVQLATYTIAMLGVVSNRLAGIREIEQLEKSLVSKVAEKSQTWSAECGALDSSSSLFTVYPLSDNWDVAFRAHDK